MKMVRKGRKWYGIFRNSNEVKDRKLEICLPHIPNVIKLAGNGMKIVELPERVRKRVGNC